MVTVLQWRVLSLTAMVFYQVQSKVATITVICVWSDGPPCEVGLRWVVLSTDQPAMTKRGGKARHALEKCMMGCQYLTGAGGIDWEDWQWLDCLLLSKENEVSGGDGCVLAGRAVCIETAVGVESNDTVYRFILGLSNSRIISNYYTILQSQVKLHLFLFSLGHFHTCLV